MEEIHKIRRQNLLALIEQFTSFEHLARQFGKSTETLYSWIESDTPQPISDIEAREIEQALSLPNGCLDNDDNPDKEEVLRELAKLPTSDLQRILPIAQRSQRDVQYSETLNVHSAISLRELGKLYDEQQKAQGR